MSRGDVGAFVRRWWFLGLSLLTLGIAWGSLTAAVATKADRSAVELMQTDLQYIREQVTDMNARQRAWFCRDSGAWCR